MLRVFGFQVESGLCREGQPEFLEVLLHPETINVTERLSGKRLAQIVCLV